MFPPDGGCELADDSRGWFDAAGLVAWCLVGVIGVRPDLRGRGLSRLLIDAAIERLADRGVTEMTLTTDVPATLATATSTGFTEHRRTHWLTRPRATST